MPGPDPTTPSGKRTIPRGKAREVQLMAVAIEVLALRGYEGFTMDEFATRARTSKTTIYRRWRSKAELIADAVQRVAGISEGPIDTGSIRDDLFTLFRRIGTELNNIPDAAKSLVTEPRRNVELLTAFDERFRFPAQRAVAGVIEQAHRRGELKPGATAEFVHDIAVPLLLMRSLWVEPLDDAFVQHLVDEVICPLIVAPEGPRIHPDADHPSRPV